MSKEQQYRRTSPPQLADKPLIEQLRLGFGYTSAATNELKELSTGGASSCARLPREALQQITATDLELVQRRSLQARQLLIDATDLRVQLGSGCNVLARYQHIHNSLQALQSTMQTLDRRVSARYPNCWQQYKYPASDDEEDELDACHKQKQAPAKQADKLVEHHQHQIREPPPPPPPSLQQQRWPEPQPVFAMPVAPLVRSSATFCAAPSVALDQTYDANPMGTTFVKDAANSSACNSLLSETFSVDSQPPAAPHHSNYGSSIGALSRAQPQPQQPSYLQKQQMYYQQKENKPAQHSNTRLTELDKRLDNLNRMMQCSRSNTSNSSLASNDRGSYRQSYDDSSDLNLKYKFPSKTGGNLLGSYSNTGAPMLTAYGSSGMHGPAGHRLIGAGQRAQHADQGEEEFTPGLRTTKRRLQETSSLPQFSDFAKDELSSPPPSSSTTRPPAVGSSIISQETTPKIPKTIDRKPLKLLKTPEMPVMSNKFKLILPPS